MAPESAARNAIARPRIARKKAAKSCRAANIPRKSILHRRWHCSSEFTCFGTNRSEPSMQAPEKEPFRRHHATLLLSCTAMKIETRAVHAGRKIESGTRDVTPAIHLSTTYQKAD